MRGEEEEEEEGRERVRLLFEFDGCSRRCSISFELSSRALQALSVAGPKPDGAFLKPPSRSHELIVLTSSRRNVPASTAMSSLSMAPLFLPPLFRRLFRRSRALSLRR